METVITSGDDWRPEEAFFDARRHDLSLEIVDKKWSEGSSPIMLVLDGVTIRASGVTPKMCMRAKRSCWRVCKEIQ